MLKKTALILLAGTILAMTTSAAVHAQDYVVGEGDILKITVYDHDDLETVVRVEGGGTISFPLIGQVRVGGLTVSRVTEVLAERLADGYLVNPQLGVFVQEFRSRKSTIMGKVRRPGLYELHGQTTFLELLSKAGGLDLSAGDRAFIKRKPEGRGEEGKVVVVDLKLLIEKGDTTHDVAIMDGDSIFIAEAGVFYITGEVKRPNAYKLEKGTTVIKAITIAGGFTDTAARDRVIVVRAAGGAEETITIGTGGASWDNPILNGDSIYIPKAGTFYVTGEVKKAGAYAYETGTTVLKAITVAGGFTDKASKGKVRIIRIVDGEEKTLKKVGLDDPVFPDDVLVVPESFF
jgi:polysaccharide export outer membrane protein